MAEAGMSGTDWLLSAWSLDFPDYRYVQIAGFGGGLFLLRPAPAFLPLLIWEGSFGPGLTWRQLVDEVYVLPD